MKLKIAVLAPILKARDNTAIPANAGLAVRGKLLAESPHDLDCTCEGRLHHARPFNLRVQHGPLLQDTGDGRAPVRHGLH
jgi:hypothetical protein